MFSLAIKFSVVTTVLYIGCMIAVKYAERQTAYYDSLLALIKQEDLKEMNEPKAMELIKHYMDQGLYDLAYQLMDILNWKTYIAMKMDKARKVADTN